MSRDDPWTCPICKKGPCVCTEHHRSPLLRALRERLADTLPARAWSARDNSGWLPR